MSKQAAERSRSQRAAAMVEAQQRQERRRKQLIVGAVVAVVVAVLGTTYAVSSGSDTSGETASDVPAGVGDDYGVTVGEESAPTTITVYEDPQCPICSDFEAAVGDRVAEAVDAGRVKVDYRIVSFLDRASANDYSSRAANALLVVQDAAGPEAFAALHEILYENQPEEGSEGPDDDQLVQWAVRAGAEESQVRGPIESMAFAQYVVNATDRMSKSGVTGTPTVLIDGKPAGTNPSEYVAAVREAVSPG